MKLVKLFPTGEAIIHLTNGNTIPTNGGYIFDNEFIELEFDCHIVRFGKVEKIEDELGIVSVQEFINSVEVIRAYIDTYNQHIYLQENFEKVAYLDGEVIIEEQKIIFDNSFNVAVINSNSEVYELMNNYKYNYLGRADKINGEDAKKYYKQSSKHLAFFKKFNQQWIVEVEPIENETAI